MGRVGARPVGFARYGELGRVHRALVGMTTLTVATHITERDGEGTSAGERMTPGPRKSRRECGRARCHGLACKWAEARVTQGGRQVGPTERRVQARQWRRVAGPRMRAGPSTLG
jgi:hypothetical protein